ncbi:MAG: shikimate kinase [bacterium]|nr:shikimate kinase [bacterium]
MVTPGVYNGATTGVAPVDQNLVLTGYIGPEQLSIARRCAERLRMPFLDFATRFEDRTATTADALRAQYGDARLRSIESDLMDEIALARGSVIHISGQVLLGADHYALMRATGPVICLVATLDAVLQRLHLALGARYHDPKERGLALGTLRREWAIRTLPEIVEIDTSTLSEADMIDRITETWRALTGVIDWGR